MFKRVAGILILLLSSIAVAPALANPNQGPGGPILVVTNGNANFGRFYAEILRTEGFNSFAVADVGSLNSTLLSSYDVVLLAKVPLTSGQVTTLTNWVNAGGNLIAMDPVSALHTLAGISSTGATLSNAYMRVDTSNPIGNGIVGETMQFHGTATRFTPVSAAVLATLYSNRTTATSNSAVTLRAVGPNGGQVAVFAYDLATSIVYTRQGNPAWVGQERDGVDPIRSDDLFTGGGSEPDWIDLERVSIPQADEQQRFLANLITHMNLDRKPLPRFWYFPHGHKAVVVMSGDDHAQGHQGWGATEARFNQYIAASPPGCSAEDWECVRGTSYVFTSTDIDDSIAAALEAQGFEIGLHVRPVPNSIACDNYTAGSLEDLYTEQLAEFAQRFPSLSAPRTMRHHCVVWSDWASGAKVQFNHGIRLDTSYYWPPDWAGFSPGHFTGSAMPMRFADLDGSLIDVYQVVTQMTDESNQQYPFTPDTLLDRALSDEEQYGVYTVNAHTDVAVIPESDTVVESAQERGVPIVSSRQLLTWLDARSGSSFGALSWLANENTLTFTITPASGARGLTALVPRHSTGSSVLSAISRNGADVEFTVVKIKGLEYAAFAAAAGDYAAVYAADVASPTIGSRSPAPGASGVAQQTTIAVTFSEPMDPSSIGSDTIELRNFANQVVPATVSYNPNSFTATLTPAQPLGFSETYTVVVRGGALDPRAKDLAGNPLAANASWSFGTAVDPCPCTLWTENAVPFTAANDGEGVNLGVRFRSDIAGFITGVRFYKVSGSTGQHTAFVWSASGQLLASAPFTNESGVGWQQVNLASPVAISADTNYVVAYHATDGRFGISPGYFANNGVDRNMLHAPGGGPTSSNGVFAYGVAGLFPSNSWNASNYWVDVVFSATIGAGDTTPPVVTITSPTSTPTHTTSSPILALGGTASDNVGITQVIWSNDRGGAGSASITGGTWTVGGVALAQGVNLVTVTASDAAGNTASDTLTVTYTPGPADTTPPTITGHTPANGATNVAINALVTMTFSEAMDAATINSSTIELRSGANTVVPATLSYDGTSVTLLPNTLLANGTTYTITVRGGGADPRVKDVAGNALAANFVWSFTTVAAPTINATLWSTATPPAATADDTDGVEVGVKFSSSVGGYITGIRFFKASANTGVHIGNLWSSTGQLLASATFTGETDIGWQLVEFASPVAIQANTTYIASYYAPNGRFTISPFYFNNGGHQSGVLYAPSVGESGGNGVFAYGAQSQFPADSWGGSNYWVDAIFTTAPDADTTPPTVTITSPTSASAHTTSASSVTLSGTASDDGLLTQVSWVSNRGGSGTMAGTGSWTSSSIALASGANVITVTARDAAGNTSTDVITITRN